MEKDKFCVDADSTIKDIMLVIESIRERGVVVIEENKVCGVLTLGDIIRALAEGMNTYAKITKIYSSNFIYLKEENLEEAFEIFKAKNISLIPVIDNEYHLISVITPRDVMSKAHFE